MQKTALHVCLLLLDVALACQDASKSAVSSVLQLLPVFSRYMLYDVFLLAEV